MSLTKDEVLKVAHLARLEFAEDEIERFRGDLNNILKFVEKLQEVDTQGVEPLFQVNHNEENKFRKDEIKESLDTEKALLNAPEKEDGMFIVPKVVGEN
ncbi:MAG: Asp-tRNA(Asn)/Glu-tRNA(Gln) amidotransferase subunit GatC [Fusobacteriaceae bacterium]|nr:Asp-tRNA(Asn)/Glu-tRNA(Gln) amidotransferase subunit GatC [Fusobacteriaceae bacterium]MBN2837978.1 Asp-tRNA(Asn)/Glu-tRNA(Gln) amidotransferase subunit GatC [Fusobacteriaceae bacterium]